MFYLNKQKIVIMFVICLCLSATKVLACKCSIASASSSVNKAAKVFSGKVVGFEYRKGIASSIIDFREKATGVKIDYETKVVKVQVERWWKGNVPGKFFWSRTAQEMPMGHLCVRVVIITSRKARVI